MTCAHLFLSLLACGSPAHSTEMQTRNCQNNSQTDACSPNPHSQQRILLPLVSFCTSHQPPLLSCIILLPWMSRCVNTSLCPSQRPATHRRAVTWGPVPRAKNSRVSLQVNLENLIVSEQHSKPQVVAKLVLSTGIFTELLSFGYPEAAQAGAVRDVMC